MDAPDLRTALRDAVHRTTDALPVTAPPWPDLQRRHRRARRLRHSTLAAAVAGTLLALTAALGPGAALFSPAPAPAAPAPELGDQPRGRLARDPAWCAAMLRRAATESLGANRPDRVVFADDVGGYRVALIRLRFSPSGWMLAWYTGPQGAAAPAMTEQAADDPARAYSFVINPSAADPGHATVIVVGPSGATMAAWTNNDVGPDGHQLTHWPTGPVTAVQQVAGGGSGREISRVTGGDTGQEISPGVYTMRLATPFPQVVVKLLGLPDGDWRADVHATESAHNPPRLTDAQWWTRSWTGARGAATATPPAGLEVQQLYDRLALRSDVSGGRVLWVQPGTASPEVVLALRAPSGGWALVAQSTSDGDTEAVVLRPAGPLDGAALAWQLTDQPDPKRGYQVTTKLGLLGPAAATTAVVDCVPSGDIKGVATLMVPLTEGAAVTDTVARATGVQFLDARGNVLATTTVTPHWDPASGVLSQQQ